MTGFKTRLYQAHQRQLCDYPFEDLTEEELEFLWECLENVRDSYSKEYFVKPGKIYKTEDLDNFTKSKFEPFNTREISINDKYFIVGHFNKLVSFNRLSNVAEIKTYFRSCDIENLDDKLTLFRYINHYKKGFELVEKLKKSKRNETLEIAYELEKILNVSFPYFH